MRRDDPEGIRAAAARGVDTPGGALPHLDAIQRSFGRHDVSHLKAHVGTEASAAAAAMGAEAFATGNHVVFDGPPGLHTAAHEAAHAVQQRGTVQLAGGVGEVGDRYEQHADAVADLVVRGESAEVLLDENAPAGRSAPPAGPVQRTLIKVGGVPVPGTEAENENAFIRGLGNYSMTELGQIASALRDLMRGGKATAFDRKALTAVMAVQLERHKSGAAGTSTIRQTPSSAMAQPPAMPVSSHLPSGAPFPAMPVPSHSSFTASPIAPSPGDVVLPSNLDASTREGGRREDEAEKWAEKWAENRGEEEASKDEAAGSSEQLPPEGGGEPGSALAEAYIQLCTLGFDLLESNVRSRVWSEVRKIERAAPRVFGVSTAIWNAARSRDKVIRFGLLFSPLVTPSALIASTDQYNEIDVDTSHDDIAVRSVFLVDKGERVARRRPQRFKDKFPDVLDAMRFAHAKGLKIYLPMRGNADPPTSHTHEPQPDLFDRDNSVKAARAQLAGPELDEWGELEATRKADVEASGRASLTIEGIPIHEAAMALVTVLDLTSDRAFFEECVTEGTYPDRGRGMRCASLVGDRGESSADVYPPATLGLELGAAPKRLMTMAPGDLQSPDPRKSDASIPQYLELAARAQIVAQYVRIMAEARAASRSEPAGTSELQRKPGSDDMTS